MAAPAKKTTKKTTSKTTAKAPQSSDSAPAKKKTTRKSTTKKSTAKQAAEGKITVEQAPSTTPLFEREPVVLFETAGYAVTGVLTDVIELAKGLPSRFEEFRADPTKREKTIADLRDRLGKDLERYIASFEKVVDSKAAEGKKTLDEVTRDERVARVLDQTSSTRSQLKAAFTSVTKTADVAAEAAGKQADTARTQVKGASSTVRSSTEQAQTAVKGAATSVRKIADVAVDAATKQAGNARSQVKAAATSVRKSAETVADAATGHESSE